MATLPEVRSIGKHDEGKVQVWKRRFSYAQFAAAATSDTEDIVFPGGLEIVGARIWLVTNFTGGAVSACTFSAGTTGSATLYVNAGNIFANARIIRVGAAQVPGTFLNATDPELAGTIRFTLTTTGANTNALTAGALDAIFLFRYFHLKR